MKKENKNVNERITPHMKEMLFEACSKYGISEDDLMKYVKAEFDIWDFSDLKKEEFQETMSWIKYGTKEDQRFRSTFFSGDEY